MSEKLSQEYWQNLHDEMSDISVDTLKLIHAEATKHENALLGAIASARQRAVSLTATLTPVTSVISGGVILAPSHISNVQLICGIIAIACGLASIIVAIDAQSPRTFYLQGSRPSDLLKSNLLTNYDTIRDQQEFPFLFQILQQSETVLENAQILSDEIGHQLKLAYNLSALMVGSLAVGGITMIVPPNLTYLAIAFGLISELISNFFDAILIFLY